MDDNRQDQLNDIMAQAQRMQEHLGYAQTTLQEAEVVGSGGNGAVSITMVATGEIRGVRIDADSVELDRIDLLEARVKEAFEDAANQIRTIAEDLMRPMAESINGWQ